MTVLQTNIPVTSQTIFFSLVNDEQIPGHSVVSMFVRHTAVHVFVCGREHHIHYTAAVKEEGITAGECPVTSTGGLKCTHTRTHVHTRKLCFAARCRKQVKYCTLQNKENVGDNPDSRKMWTLSKTSIQTECDCLLMLFHIHSTERRYISCFTWKGSAALTFYTVDQLFWNQGHMLMTFPTEAAARQYVVCDNSQLESFQLRPWRKYSWQSDSLSHFWPSSPN